MLRSLPRLPPREASASGLVEAEWVARWFPAMLLTVFDASLTYAWLSLGVANEANPWLAQLVEAGGAGPAMLFRASIGLALVASLALLARRYASARYGLVAVTGALGAVCSWHLLGGMLVAVV